MEMILTIVVIAIIIAVAYKMYKRETFIADVNYAPLEITDVNTAGKLRPSIWNYYGTSSDRLMDQVASGKPVSYPPKGIYCDRPNNNRSFLVNPVITDKNIFIAPNRGTGWADSAYDVHPEFAWQVDPVFGLSGDDAFYSNFSDTVKRLKNGSIKLYADNYNYRCGTSCPKPKDTYNVNY